MLLQNLECVIVEGCGSTITATELSLLANCRQLHTLCITTTATIPHIGTQSLSSLTCLHTLALHVQSRDCSFATEEEHAVSDLEYPLPAGLDALTMLTSLSLSGWRHAMLLPTAISRLKRLRLLSLQKCSIMSLPDSLLKLTDLENLNLHMNDIGRYAHLVLRLIDSGSARHGGDGYNLVCQTAGMSCRNTQLLAPMLKSLGARTHHSTACHMPQLTSIVLSVSFLQVLPKFLGGASKLRSLDLSYNDFGSKSLDDLSSLTELILISCRLTKFPSCTAQMGCMKELWLRSNKIASLPDDMPWDNLRVLHMQYNNLLDFPYTALEAAPQLSYLNISDNRPLL